jgi:hypothetical protein
MTVSAALPAPARFLPWREAAGRPHVVVDGPPQEGTVLTLSHWPGNPTPPALRRDTSTATVFAYLDDPGSHVAVPAVTNSHFDEDGLFSAFALGDPEQALASRDLLVAASFAGDFGIVRSRDAARLCFAIETLSDPVQSTLPSGTFTAPDRVAALYGALLPMVPELATRLPAYRALWEEQDEHLARSRELLADAEVTLEELPELDLAIVRIPETVTRQMGHRTARRYLRPEAAPIHPFAINTATSCSRLLKVQGRRYEFQYRYESWVRLASRRVPLRVSLDGLCRRLNDRETAPGTWHADSLTREMAPVLALSGDGESGIPFDAFLGELREALTTAPVVWDPYDWTPDPPAASSAA